jgi:hypothetical protein
MDGTYSFVYRGFFGVGMGLFKVTDGSLVGVDFGGGRYRGTIVVGSTTREMDLAIQMTVPAGVFLVQGTSAQDLEYTKMVSTKVHPNFNEGRPFDVMIPPGSVTLMVVQIPDDWEPYTAGFRLTIAPI